MPAVPNGTGVLILSEMAGAAKELSEAILINPNDVNQMVSALYLALTISEENQRVAIASMMATVQKYNIHHWVKIFMDRLAYTKEKQNALKTTLLQGEFKKNVN